MSGPKIAILILVVILLLFAAAMLFTERGNSPRNRNNSEDANKPTPSLVKWLGGLFSPEPPKLKLSPSRFVLNQNQSQDVEVPPSDEDFRTATFVLKNRGRVRLVYDDRTPGAGKDLQHQDMELPRRPRDPDDDRMRGSLTVLKRGGTLRIQCLVAPCELVLEQ